MVSRCYLVTFCFAQWNELLGQSSLRWQRRPEVGRHVEAAAFPRRVGRRVNGEGGQLSARQATRRAAQTRHTQLSRGKEALLLAPKTGGPCRRLPWSKKQTEAIRQAAFAAEC